jgi:putative phosphoesterase
MNILVLSDSHGDIDVMASLVRRVRPQEVLHLGDHFSDMVKLHLRFPEIPMQGVRGNCDAPGSPERLRLTMEGVTMLLVHGHRQGVKEDLERLYFTALEAEADLVLFGHTHRPLMEREGNVTFLNPGSIGRGYPPSYALLRLGEGPVSAEILTL